MSKHFSGCGSAEYAACRELWAECFTEDGEAFVDYYFNNRTRPEYVLCDINKETGSLRGALHMLPTPLRVRGVDLPAALIAGVATAPEYRGLGVATGLMRMAEDALREQGRAAAILQPADDALFGFYERLGYEPLCGYTELELRVESCGRSDDFRANPQGLLAIYNDCRAAYDSYFVRDISRYEQLLTEYSRCGGFCAADGFGYLMGYVEGGICRVYECCGVISGELLTRFAAACGHCSLSIIAPEAAANGIININNPNITVAAKREKPFNMIKRLDKSKVCDMGAVLSFERY